ncbi:CRISPR-associated ring nuclease Csm6 [Endozoicomonas montiporae]|uniref:CRISPR-associated protein n=1 Tax=Endozoicomonas montiporae CL-33 TaxID=570277 RepID=A0A142BBT9_9GAMM|nr:CRISPR-associated ring nuclease Csm6 [Endozoicomonas montiporae]AMO56215.1 CRISPR-associated protein [Endozoicomonas montiporae CL-33]
MTESGNYKNILFVASGMSPQILTETLYALMVQDKPLIPDEIHLVTTVQGREKARAGLLDSGKGQFYRFCEDYGFSPDAFSERTIHVIHDAQGNALNDIKTPSDNEATADTITRLIQQFTADPDTRLHVSLAGGRKTMSYYTGYALSLYGRKQDQLSHVLVSEGYESCHDFYYPTPESRMLENRFGEPCDAADAEVTLANIPFVRLREDLPERFLQGKACFSETIRIMGKVDEPRSLNIHVQASTITVSGCVVPIADLELAFLLMFARDLQINGDEAGYELPGKSGSAAIGRPYLRALCEIKGIDYTNDWSELEGRLIDQDINPRTLKSLTNGLMKSSFYSQRRNELMRLLKIELGKKLAECYLPQPVNGKGGEHRLLLNAGEVSVTV